MKKIAHEVPLSLLELSRSFNDYDYALVHLFPDEPKYYEFYKKSVEMGRHVLLDNSLFELGTAYDSDQFADWIMSLRPTEFVIPDVFDDAKGTVESLHRWIDSYGDLPGKTIGVVQGKTYEEFVWCYNQMMGLVDKLAITFSSSYYTNVLPYMDKNWARTIGRQTLISTLLHDEVINTDMPHHLLGAGLPQEYAFYQSKQFDFITQLDTSNPVVHGIKGIAYEPWGLKEKESTKLVDLLHEELEPGQLWTVMKNIVEFKNFVNSKKL